MWKMILVLPVLSLLFVAGCGGGSRNKPVRAEIAKSSLIKVLEHWKSGSSMDELQKQSPQIVVQEAHWSNGATLEAFELVGDGRPEDASWYCEVQLTLKPKDGGEVMKKSVTYVVGTDPVITVFRAIL